MTVLIFLWMEATITDYNYIRSGQITLEHGDSFCHLVGKPNIKKCDIQIFIRKELVCLSGMWLVDTLQGSVPSLSISAVGNNFTSCCTPRKMAWTCWMSKVGLKGVCHFSLTQSKSGRQHLLQSVTWDWLKICQAFITVLLLRPILLSSTLLS